VDDEDYDASSGIALKAFFAGWYAANEVSRIMTTPNICVFCHNASPVNHENGVMVSYKSEGKRVICVLLHKSCAAEWSKRFMHSVPIQIAAVD
jgi:nitrate/TMAO reductase-like tetraheme cytochrome c subunit